MMKILFPISCLLLLVGCQKPSGRWEALEEVKVFKKADETDEQEYIVEKGEICALGKEQVVKVFMYRNISCRKGNGWILYEGGYPFRKLD